MIFSALHDKLEEFSEQKIFILVSTVMTWACSKAVDPVGGAHLFNPRHLLLLAKMIFRLSRFSGGP